MARDGLLYLCRREVEQVGLSMAEFVEAIDEMFQQKGRGNVEMPPKVGIRPRTDAFILAMPAYIPGLESAGMKWVGGYPENPGKGLPYLSGLLILNDPDTGVPIAAMDCTWITAMRTGAATAVAAKYLARPDSTSVGIVACGVQGRTNLEALCCLFDIRNVKAYDVRAESAERYAEEMNARLGVAVEPVREVRQAVQGLDIVVTSLPTRNDPEPSIPAGWLAEGAFACPLDYDTSWQAAAMAEVDKFATDDLGQVEHYKHDGFLRSLPPPYADLGQIAAGIKPGRESSAERTMSMNLGIALEDMATAIRVYRRARELGIGTELPL